MKTRERAPWLCANVYWDGMDGSFFRIVFEVNWIPDRVVLRFTYQYGTRSDASAIFGGATVSRLLRRREMFTWSTHQTHTTWGTQKLGGGGRRQTEAKAMCGMVHLLWSFLVEITQYFISGTVYSFMFPVILAPGILWSCKYLSTMKSDNN